MTDFRQTSDKLRTDFRRQSPTSDFGPRPDFEHQTSDFGLQTLNFRLRVRILDFGYTSDRPSPSDFELWSLNFRLWTI